MRFLVKIPLPLFHFLSLRLLLLKAILLPKKPYFIGFFVPWFMLSFVVVCSAITTKKRPVLK